MSDHNLVPEPEVPSPSVDAGDQPPVEPDASSSNRAVRGSPIPALVTDPVPDPFSPISAPSSSRALPSDPIPISPSVPPLIDDAAPPAEPHPVHQQPDETVLPPTHPSDPGSQVREDLVTGVLDLGFEQFDARLAVRRTNNTSVEAAVNWLLERCNASDFEESEDEEGEMGGSSSVPAAAQLFGSGRTHKMVLVANTSLKMGTGKLAAQVGHATLAVYRSAMGTDEGRAALEEWKRRGEVKIVVKGESTEQLMDLFKMAKDEGLWAYLVQDAGYTQIPPGSRTVLGVFGKVEDVDKVTKQLKLL